MCSATDGATPVNACTWAASAIFSSGVRGTPACGKTLNRVPELPNAQDGSSMRWARSAAVIVSRSAICLVLRSSPGQRLLDKASEIEAVDILRVALLRRPDRDLALVLQAVP